MGNKPSVETYKYSDMDKEQWKKKLEEDGLLQKWKFGGSKFGCILKNKKDKDGNWYRYDDVYGNRIDVDYVTSDDSRCHLIPVVKFITSSHFPKK
jgi:hypothetical protein